MAGSSKVKKAIPSAVKFRHRQTAINFRRWMTKNPTANLERRVQAFNALADAEFYQIDTNKPKRPIKDLAKNP